MFDLGQKIEEFTEELFVDLGLTGLAEEQKADLFARVEEHLHREIVSMLRSRAALLRVQALEQSLAHENYQVLKQTLKQYPQLRQPLEDMIETELDKLKLTIAEEQKNAGEKQRTPAEVEPGNTPETAS